MSKETPHRIDWLRERGPQLREHDRSVLIEYYELAMQFAPRVMSNDLVITGFLTHMVAMGGVDINTVRMLCMTERIHRELSA